MTDKLDQIVSCWFAGTSLDSNGDRSSHWVDVNDTSNRLNFAASHRDKFSLFRIGFQYPLKTNGEKWQLPTWADVDHDAEKAPGDLLAKWEVRQRASQQLKKVLSYKPTEGLTKTVSSLRGYRNGLSLQKRAQFDAWLIEQLRKDR